MRSLAGALEAGQATYLDGVKTKTQFETLQFALRRAKTRHVQHKQIAASNYGDSTPFAEREADDARRPDATDIRFAGYPFPTIYQRHLDEAVTKGKGTRGVKKSAAKINRATPYSVTDFVTFENDHDIADLREFLGRCNAAGIDVAWMQRSFGDYDRLHRANIYTVHELRSALRELLPHLVCKREDDPIAKAEQALIGKKLPGFFPTPRPIIEQMLEAADIQDNDRILEPSAGKGDILDMVRDRHPNADLRGIEQQHILIDILTAKGHQVEQGDFLEYADSQYTKILMNPPFEQLADVDHVRHAYGRLAPGGRLVAIMSESPFFRQDSKAEAFRNWLDEVEGESEQLPEDSFKGVEAFRETGVRTRLVSICSPA
jgi:hypothetical protein